MRVFITGAAGFIGRALLERYAADGHETRGCDLVADPARDVVCGDVGQAGAWQDHAAGCELVIHTAATVSLRLERPEEVWRANVLGTAHAIEAAARGGAKRFVHFSSVTAFGFEFPDGVDETYPVHNTYVPYPDTKIASEQVVLQAHIEGRISATIVRPGDVYGPRSRAWAVIPVQLMRGAAVHAARRRARDSARRFTSITSSTASCSRRPRRTQRPDLHVVRPGRGVVDEFFRPHAELVGRRLSPFRRRSRSGPRASFSGSLGSNPAITTSTRGRCATCSAAAPTRTPRRGRSSAGSRASACPTGSSGPSRGCAPRGTGLADGRAEPFPRSGRPRATQSPTASPFAGGPRGTSWSPAVGNLPRGAWSGGAWELVVVGPGGAHARPPPPGACTWRASGACAAGIRSLRLD